MIMSLGSGIVQFAPSSLRRHQHFRKLVLRILKITKDETYKGFDKPKEGKLMRRHHRLGQHKIWSLDIDSPAESVRHPEALKFLYQSSQTAGVQPGLFTSMVSKEVVVLATVLKMPDLV